MNKYGSNMEVFRNSVYGFIPFKNSYKDFLNEYGAENFIGEIQKGFTKIKISQKGKNSSIEVDIPKEL